MLQVAGEVTFPSAGWKFQIKSAALTRRPCARQMQNTYRLLLLIYYRNFSELRNITLHNLIFGKSCNILRYFLVILTNLIVLESLVHLYFMSIKYLRIELITLRISQQIRKER